MPTAYPASIDSYSTKLDGVSDVLAADINNLQDAVVALQNRVGTTAGPTFLPRAGGTMTGTLVSSTRVGMRVATSSNDNMYELVKTGVVGYGMVITSDNRLTLSQTDGAGNWSKTLFSVNTSGDATVAGALNVVGNVTTTGSVTASGNITANSDERLKTNWRDLPENFLELLADVKHGVYDRKDTGITQAGVSAQSLRGVLPQTVLEDSSGLLSVSYGNAALVAAIELAREVVSLRRELNELKGA